MSDWINVHDRLPEDQQSVLIAVNVPGHLPVQFATCIDDAGEVWFDSGYTIGDEITHWMPLPEPPVMK